MSNSHVSSLRENFKNLIKFDYGAVEYASEDSEPESITISSSDSVATTSRINDTVEHREDLPSDIRESEDSVLQWQLAQQRKEDKAKGYGAEVLFPGDKVPRLTRKVSNTSMN